MILIILTLGLTGLAMLLFQVATGLRWIHFRGLLHMQVHRWVGLGLVALIVVHALIAINTLVIRIF
jgi:hypothetical protein